MGNTSFSPLSLVEGSPIYSGENEVSPVEGITFFPKLSQQSTLTVTAPHLGAFKRLAATNSAANAPDH